ncbi:MAG TPA: hypothetical protein VFZ65_05460 [Planctomycetota bacterium]|nr:hypothetical protein [Planctomycetota bacterium]
MKLATTLFSLSAMLPVCTGQEPAAKLTAHSGTFVMEAGETKLTDLIDRCAVQLGWNILTNPQEMAGAGGPAVVQLQNKITTDGPGCEELLTSMLYRSGFALTTLDASKNLYEVINLAGPRAREITMRATQRTPEQVLSRPNLKVAVTVAMPLEHINAMVATNALRPFFASTGAGSSSLTIGNVGNVSSILISGFQDQVAAAIRLVETCDVAPPEEHTTPPLEERIEAIERRLDALERKLAGKAQDR